MNSRFSLFSASPYVLPALVLVLFAFSACSPSTTDVKSNVNVNSQQNQIVTRELTLLGGRHLVVSTQLARPSDPWLVYLPGSGDGLNHLDKFEAIQILTAHRSYNVLVINKVGIALDGSDPIPDNFQRGSIRSQRIRDNLTVMKQLVPETATILLLSLSEGSYIAPEIALADTRVKAQILLSGNTWSWLEEEVNYLPVDQRQALRDFLENEVVPDPVFNKFYGDFWSYAYFDSYNTDLTYRTLVKSQLPILALNGEKDDVLWIDGAVQNMDKLINVEGKKNIEFHMIPNASHMLRCFDDDTSCDQAAMSNLIRGYLNSFVDRIM